MDCVFQYLTMLIKIPNFYLKANTKEKKNLNVKFVFKKLFPFYY